MSTEILALALLTNNDVCCVRLFYIEVKSYRDMS